MKKFCVKCGRQFDATGREVICPSCKAQAAEESKRAAVMRAKRASWNGESVPVRISGRASAVIRRYGAANGMPFAEALDALLKSTNYFKGTGTTWQDVEPYRSRRRDKAAADKRAADFLHDKQDAPQEVKQAAKQAGKVTTSTAASKAASKAVKTSKTAAGKGGKA